MVLSPQRPRWLQVLLTEKFFNVCRIHEDAKKNEKNIYCLDCCFSICPHCLSPHSSHRLLQIRRYVYRDVVRLDDATKLMDCDFVQSYKTNSAKVIFINQKPRTRQFRGSGNFCNTCDRSFQDPYLFCSLSCKINYLLGTKDGLSKFLFERNFLPSPEAGLGLGLGLDDHLVTPDTILEPSGSTMTSSGLCRPTCPPASQVSKSLMNRRKKTPHRAPLY